LSQAKEAAKSIRQRTAAVEEVAASSTLAASTSVISAVTAARPTATGTTATIASTGAAATAIVGRGRCGGAFGGGDQLSERVFALVGSVGFDVPVHLFGSRGLRGAPLLGEFRGLADEGAIGHPLIVLAAEKKARKDREEDQEREYQQDPRYDLVVPDERIAQSTQHRSSLPVSPRLAS